MSIHASVTTDAATESLLSAPEIRTEGILRRIARHRSAQMGFGILMVFVVGTIVAPTVFHNDPSNNWLYQSVADARLGSSAQHLLGTDQLGRDELLRLAYGARFTLLIGLAAVVLGLAVGVPLGAISGYFGGVVDLLVQRLVDIVLAFPTFLLALSLVAALGGGLTNVIISVAVTSFPRFVRLLRASALSVREQPYVEAARALGVPAPLVLFRHIVPNSVAPVIVQATLDLGGAILTAAGLGFLGVGIQQPTPEWGAMLGGSREFIYSNPNLITFPGLCIMAAVLAFNLVGDALRDVLDPRLKG
jgi:peptide/nickel transport system permease protein